jgi:hypothetical protein
MWPTSRSFSALPLLVTFFLMAPSDTICGQTSHSGEPELDLKAALVLTPEFCATKMKKDVIFGNETFEVGKAACAELEPSLKRVFSRLTCVAAASAQGDAQVVLIPKFVDLSATWGVTAFSNRELVVLLEWTVKDSSGRTVWIETISGSATHHAGNLFTANKNRNLLVEDSVKDIADQSASKMSSASEFRKLTSN